MLSLTMNASPMPDSWPPNNCIIMISSLVKNGMDLLKLEPLGMLEMGFITYRLILRKKQAVIFVGKSFEHMSWRGRMLTFVFSIMSLSLKSLCQWWTGTLGNRSVGQL